jgi:hypothetical protein
VGNRVRVSKRVWLVSWLLVLGLLTPLIGYTTRAADAYSGAFLSFPRQAAPLSVTGTNVVVANKSWVGFHTKTCLTVHDAHNVSIFNVDFAGCGGGIFLVNVTGKVNITNVRARNTGDGTIGSGHGNVIQLNNVWQSAPELPLGIARIRSIKAYGGDTEDVISVYKSGGIDAAHPLVIGDVHVEHPLTGTLAWSSPSGTCANLADAGGHDIRLQNSTFLNCGQVGIQMNEPGRNVRARNNTVYGQRRLKSNVGLSQWSSGDCPSRCPGNEYRGNRVWWVKANAVPSPMWLSRNYPVADLSNYKQLNTINLANLRVRFT